MTLVESLLAFTAAATVLTVTPGLDTALMLRTVGVGGPRPAAFAAVGICLGCLVWGAVVSLGLGALLAASELAFSILKWAGAAYLVWLGANLILKPREALLPADETRSTDAMASLRRGLLTNLLNPKVGVFYVSFLPQFIPAGISVAGFSMLLVAIHVLLSIVWFALLVAATVPMSGLLRRAGVVRWLDRVTGGIFIAFGLKLALSSRD